MSKFLLQCSCIICKKEYSVKGIHSHYITAHTVEGNTRIKQAGLKGCNKGGQSYANNMAVTQKEKIKEYDSNPSYCKHCNKIIPYENSQNVFCNRSCSASFSNLNRTYTKKKIKQLRPTKQQLYNLLVDGPYSKLIRCECKHCNIIKLYRQAQRYCNNCKHLYSHDGRAKFWFTFNVFHYPGLFDLSLITTYGFRNNITNPNGITRDHKVSVNDAIRNNYDPYYIKHPMNCQLMFFDENNKKKTNSSITYDELVRLVDDYDDKMT